MKGRLLDTNIWIALAKGDAGIMGRLARLQVTGTFCCSVVRAELLFGARKSQRVDENLRGVARLLEPFESLPFDDAAAAHYGVIRAVLEKAGTPVGANDLMVASIALAHDCVVVTRNVREFVRVPGLRLEEW